MNSVSCNNTNYSKNGYVYAMSWFNFRHKLVLKYTP